MQDITLEDVKIILKDKVRQTLKHIQLYEWYTNKWSEKELQDRIPQIDKKEKKLLDRLQNNFKGTTAHLAKEVDKILKDKELKPDKKNFEYKGLILRWTDLQVIRETWKRELLKGERKNENEYLKELGKKVEIKIIWRKPNTYYWKLCTRTHTEVDPKSRTLPKRCRWECLYERYNSRCIIEGVC